MKFRKRENCYYISTKGKNEYEPTDWVIFYWGWHFDISWETCGYFDPRHRINLDLIFFSLQIILPIKSKYTDECDPPKYGIAYHNQTLWIYRGGEGNFKGGNKWWTINMPWQYEWVRTSALKKSAIMWNPPYKATDRMNKNDWEHSGKKDRKSFWEDKWVDVLWTATYPYVYTLRSGEVQDISAKITIEEMEWRMKFLLWTSLFAKTRRSISISFSQEVGEGSGSWKGGCVGCSWELLPNETPEQSLRRMEKERKF